MKHLTLNLAVLLATLGAPCASLAYTHNFDSVPGDPGHSLLYTLPNGLKVYMSVNKDTPRIHTLIPVRVGSKNDPAETTGLAHYFEHMMFKGTPNFGTRDYAAEKPMLDEIERLFEVYRNTTDSVQRELLYHQIDSVSYQASLLAIPNEYDKLMNGIGANSTNAYTSYDQTCYVEDIPSNRIEEWAIVQADRFKQPVLRGFHTELETIYEEKNMSLTNDYDKVYDALLGALYPNHPYGQQSILGSQQHLKNPSITNIKAYHDKWYVPNNMAICMAGDFDPDYAVDIIEKYFGDMQPNTGLEGQRLVIADEAPITEPKVININGLDAEMLFMGWRIPAVTDEDIPVLDMITSILRNGKSGLIDKNIIVPQKMLQAGSFLYPLVDHGCLIVYGRPTAGQSLDEAHMLLLQQLAELREGKFDDNLLKAVVTNKKLDIQQMLESNSQRASIFSDAFVGGYDWADYLAKNVTRLDNVSKNDIVRVANKYLGDNNMVVINKLIGQDENIVKIPKAKITPIATNREYSSDFLNQVLSRPVQPIEPVFLDFQKDLTRTTAKDGNIEVLYTHNNTNDIFTLTYVFDYGYYADPNLFSSDIITLLGTDNKTAQQFKDDLFALGCSFRLSTGEERSYLIISGLDENAEAAATLTENLINNAVPDAETWSKYIDRLDKQRQDNKLNQSSNFGRLYTYMRYGTPDNNPALKHFVSADSLRNTNPAVITDAIRKLPTHKHRAIYYGPRSQADAVALIDKTHRTPDVLTAVPETKIYQPVHPTETIIYIAPYDSEQLYMAEYANRGEQYDPDIQPMVSLFNEYFGGSMNSIVFQEMRESRSLAYSAGAYYVGPNRKNRDYYVMAQIATQNDKLMDAINAFAEILNDMPQSESAFNLAKTGLDSRLRTERTIKDDIAWAWIDAENHGIDYDINSKVYEANNAATLDDIVKFQQEHVRDGVYHYAILGRIEDLDIESLRKLGKVVILTTEDIFGY